MFGKELLIKKYPYLGCSPNLMEYFSIIGYQECFVPQVIDAFKKNENNYTPTVLSSIISNTDYGIIDDNLIIAQIFPDNPKLIPINKNDYYQQTPNSSNIIYSFCFDSTDGKTKIFYTCYGYKFYEKYQNRLPNFSSEEYYIPKAFCIISQYAYYNLFEYICKNLYALLSQKNVKLAVPVELLIYNIINFIPSPINNNLQLNLFGSVIKIPDIEIEQLSGYPYIDFDLSEIFNLLPINLVIEIYILTVVEQSMLFFSSNLEILNMVMFIMYILNYPCNDSSYFWHIVSVSKENLIEENKFVGKIMVSLLGVNATYDESINTSAFGRYHYIVDIDNKKILFKQALDLSIDEIEDIEGLANFQKYIENILKEKSVESCYLKKFIMRLKGSLDSLLGSSLDFLPNPKNKTVRFFKMSKEISEKNRKIQEMFYDFNLNLLMIFYQDNSLNSSFDKIKKDENEIVKKINELKLNEQTIPISDDEQFFSYLFRNTVKYRIYFENFIQNQDSIDVFKIPLIFSEEFINIKMKDFTNKLPNKISYFSIIDSLYFNIKQKQTQKISLNDIITDFLEKLKNHFYSFYGLEKLKNANQQLIVLNKRVLNKYIFILNNYYEKHELAELISSRKNFEDDPISYIDRRNILNIIRSNLEQKGLIDTQNYLIFGLIYIFCIVISLHSYQKMLNYMNRLINILNKIQFFTRQNVYIIMKTLYKYYLIDKDKGLYPEMGAFSLKMYYYMLANYLKQNMIIPNEEMMYILTRFFSKTTYQERNSINKKGTKEIDSDADFDLIEGQNFLCFMKHCFTGKKIYKPAMMIKAAMKETGSYNIIIKSSKKQLQPMIVVRIKEYFYSSEFLSPKKIYRYSQNVFNDFFENANLDLNKIKIKNVRDAIVNLILYARELSDLSSFVDFLVYSLYLLRNVEANRARANSKREVLNESKDINDSEINFELNITVEDSIITK